MADNPRAFPRAHDGHEGMSLRDYFAASVLPEVYSNAKTDESLRQIADQCYSVADAMLEARKR